MNLKNESTIIYNRDQKISRDKIKRYQIRKNV